MSNIETKPPNLGREDTGKLEKPFDFSKTKRKLEQSGEGSVRQRKGVMQTPRGNMSRACSRSILWVRVIGPQRLPTPAGAQVPYIKWRSIYKVYLYTLLYTLIISE